MKIINLKCFEDFLYDLAIILFNLLFYIRWFTPCYVKHCHKNIGMISVYKQRSRKKFHSSEYKIQDFCSCFISPVIIDQMKFANVCHDKCIFFFTVSICEYGKYFFFQRIWRNALCQTTLGQILLFLSKLLFFIFFVLIHLLICNLKKIHDQIIMILTADIISYCVT